MTQHFYLYKSQLMDPTMAGSLCLQQVFFIFNNLDLDGEMSTEAACKSTYFVSSDPIFIIYDINTHQITSLMFQCYEVNIYSVMCS